MSSKFLHVCFELKSGNACNSLPLLSTVQTWPSTPVSTLHMSTWRRASTQCADQSVMSKMTVIEGARRLTDVLAEYFAIVLERVLLEISVMIVVEP